MADDPIPDEAAALQPPPPPPRAPPQAPTRERTKPQAVQRATRELTLVTPRHGGTDRIDNVVTAWTGRNPYDPTVTGPLSNGCYRYSDQSKLRKTEALCREPLPKERRLSDIDITKATPKSASNKDSAYDAKSLTQWMSSVESHMCSNGMDSIFWAIHPETWEPVNLLTEWKSMNVEQVIGWWKDPERNWDNYDMDNARWSWHFIRGSISEEIYQRVRSTTQAMEVGPVLYNATETWQRDLSLTKFAS